MDRKPEGQGEADAWPQTPLADLARRARERLGPEPDKAGPAATRAMAAIVRDLKGMPEILVTRDHTHRIKLARRGKIGAIAIEYHPNIRALELTFVGFPDTDPTTTRMHRYTFDPAPAAGGATPAPGTGGAGVWHRLDDGGELFADIRSALLKLYPELGPPP